MYSDTILDIIQELIKSYIDNYDFTASYYHDETVNILISLHSLIYKLLDKNYSEDVIKSFVENQIEKEKIRRGKAEIVGR